MTSQKGVWAVTDLYRFGRHVVAVYPTKNEAEDALGERQPWWCLVPKISFLTFGKDFYDG